MKSAVVAFLMLTTSICFADPVIFFKKNDLLTADMAKELKAVKTKIVKDKKGKPRGYQFIEVRAESSLRKFGLKKGDIVLKVNDKDPTLAMQVYETIRATNKAEIKIERNGKPKTVMVKLVD